MTVVRGVSDVQRNAPLARGVAYLMSRALTLLLFAAAICATPRGGWSQAPSLTVVRPDSVLHRLPIDGARLRAGRLVYRTALVKDSVASFSADLQVDVAETQYAGAAGWLFTQVGQQGTSMFSDSLIVSRSELRPLHWTAALGAARLAAEFTPDTIFGAMSSPLGRQNIVIGNRADLLPNMTSVDMVLTSLPLSLGWRDSIHVLVVDAGGAAITMGALAVEGEEHIIVPAGEYDCWVVSLETERGAARYWVSKESPLVIRSEQVLPQLNGAVLSRELAFAPAPIVIPPERTR